MNSQKATVDKTELRQLAEMLSIFQELPPMDRIAVQYYIKGRADAVAGNVEIPITTEQEKNASVPAGA